MLLPRRAHILNLLVLGDREARYLGVAVERERAAALAELLDTGAGEEPAGATTGPGTEPPTLLVWTSGGLPAGLASDVAAIPAVEAVTVVQGDQTSLVGTTVRGIAVHEAARVMAAAGAGEVLASELTRNLARLADYPTNPNIAILNYSDVLGKDKRWAVTFNASFNRTYSPEIQVQREVGACCSIRGTTSARRRKSVV